MAGTLNTLPDLGAYQPGTALRAALRLYAYMDKELPATLAGLPESMRPLLDVLYRGKPYNLAPDADPPPQPVGNADLALIGFSGGKDSLAAALKLRHKGLKPILMHIAGINPAYPDEVTAAKRLAIAAGMPLRILPVKIRRGGHIENPTKNQLILAMMADYGQRINCQHYAQGNTTEDSCKDLNFHAGYSDGREMYSAAAAWLRRAFPGLQLHADLLKNDTDSFATILVRDPSLFTSLQSCMMPIRYKARLTAGNNEKFGIRLMPGRCGSCYKCASEWLHLRLVGENPRNEAYENHCIGVLVKAMPTIYGKSRPATRAAALSAFIDEDILPGAAGLG